MLNNMWIKYIKFFSKRVKIPHERLGSEYGGWVFSPYDFNENTIVYSLGIGEDITFDIALIEKYGCHVFAFDPTPRSIEWLKLQNLPQKFKWFGIGLADYDGEASFNPPNDPSQISHTILDRPSTHDRAIIVKVKRLQTILEEFGYKHVNVLKMDIEGAEYNVLKDIMSTDIKPDQILVEFHHFFKNVSILKTIQATVLLWFNGYKVFHVSDSGHEYSLILNDLLKKI